MRELIRRLWRAWDNKCCTSDGYCRCSSDCNCACCPCGYM